MERIKSFLYGLNRFVAFIMSAIISFLFYSSLSGSNVFFFWFNGIFGVVADVKRVQLWDDGKKVRASLFIALSIIAFVGSSVSETLKASYKTANQEYIQSLKDNIKEQGDIIKIQKKRISDTPDEMAPEKETKMMNDAISIRDSYQDKLKEYQEINVSDESMTQFQIISDKTGIDVRIIVWIFFIIRATLLEVSVLYESSKSKGRRKYSVVSMPVDTDKRKIIFDWIGRWKSKAITENKAEAIDRLNSLTEYISELEDFSKGELYVREDTEHDRVGEKGIRGMGKWLLLPWERIKGRMRKDIS